MAFNKDKMKILKDCGLISVQIGIQTGSEHINRQIYNRQISNEAVLEVAKSLHELGLAVKYDCIFNNPYETQEDIKQTIRMFLKFPKPFFVQGYNLIFYPGTQITERALSDGKISLKAEADDFSTIQGEANTPMLAENKSVISGRFYSINYDSSKKEYLNYIFRLLGTRYVPEFVFEYFLGPETAFKRFLLKQLINLYFLLVRIKN
jgi:radical SAM superfamily enzyme YgiQ (UPF0313 family)